MSRRPWSSEDRQRFRDGDRLRASSIPARRTPGPSVEEWLSDLRDESDLFDERSGVCPGSGRRPTRPNVCPECEYAPAFVRFEHATPTHRRISKKSSRRG